MFVIDTGEEAAQPIRAKSDGVDDTQSIDLRDGVRAERFHRQIIEAIESAETIADLDDYLGRETMMLDAMFLAWPEYSARITEAAENQRIWIAPRPDPQSAQAVPHPAVPGFQTPKVANRQGNQAMNAFNNFDTGGGGSEGPWLQWSARGTLDGAIPAKSFFIRDEGGKTLFDGFKTNGVVLDIEKMQTGWCYSDGIAGQAPDWKMNPTLAQFIPQPGDDYKKGFKMRCAIGDGKTASWDQAGAAAWNAFVALVPALQQGEAGKLPLVKLVGEKHEQFKRGSTNTPILEVTAWVDRPDCLKEGVAAGVATEPATQTPPPAQPASQSAAAGGF